MKIKLPLSISKLKKKADRLFSIKRRKEESDSYGFVHCITFHVRKHWKEMDNGHFINRGYLATRYEKNNNFPQCTRCNVWRQGDHSRYRDNLIKIVGKDEVERLEKKKYETVIFARILYEKVIADCQGND